MIPVVLAMMLLGRAVTAWICGVAVAATAVAVMSGGQDVTSAVFEIVTLVAVTFAGGLLNTPVRSEARPAVRAQSDKVSTDLVGQAGAADVLPLSTDWRVVQVLGGKVVDEEEFGRRTALLSGRQREVVRLAISGLTARHIGAQLFISERTVETHLANAYERLGVHSRAELIADLNTAHSCAS